MSIILVTAMYIVGIVGVSVELLHNKSIRFLQVTVVVLFILCIVSRIGHSYDYSDLTTYVYYYQSENDAYFEPGYIAFCSFIRNNLGKSEYTYVSVIALWVICAYWSAFKLCPRMSEFPILASGRKKYVFSRNKTSVNYLSTALFAFIMYWGCCFAGEGIRQGMAISLLFFSMSLIIRRNYLLSIVPMIVAYFFHTSSVFFVFSLVLVWARKKLPDRKRYTTWLMLLITADIFINITDAISANVISNYLNSVAYLPAVTRFFVYENSDVGSYFSTQYITYHVLGLLMLWGNLEEEKYNTSVFIYYIGLSLGTVFQNTEIVMRIQWIYLSMIVFVIYYFAQMEDRFSSRTRIAAIGAYGLLQTIMCVRYLGWY